MPRNTSPEGAAREILVDKLPGCLYSLSRRPGWVSGNQSSHLRPGESLIPVVISVSAWLSIPPFGIVAEHLGIGLEDMVQGMQAVSVPDLLSVC